MTALAQNVQKSAAVLAELLKGSVYAAVSSIPKEGLAVLTHYAGASRKADVSAETSDDTQNASLG